MSRDDVTDRSRSVDGRPGAHADSRAARVLVVDDSSEARRELACGVRALGHRVVEASSGARALELLAHEPFDLTVLDVATPDVDGLEVLAFVRSHVRLRAMPVLVVADSEGDSAGADGALRLAATDWLPNDCPPELLAARVGRALERGHVPDREIVAPVGVGQLADAAALLERSLAGDVRLALAGVAARKDRWGRLASAFVRGAVSLRERRWRSRLRRASRRGLLLLLIGGVLFGLGTPLSKIAATDAPHPMGLALWVNAIVAALCLCATLWRGRWPPWERSTVTFLLWWGSFGAAAEVALFQVARFVPASTLSVLIVMEVFFVFAFMTLTRHERATARRFAGLLLGLVGVFILARSYEGDAFGGAAPWLLLSLSVPVCYAVEDVLLELRLPPTIDLVAASGLASLVGTAVLAGPVWWFGDAVALSGAPASVVIAVAAIAITTAVATVLDARLTVLAGAIFASQMTYVITLAGIFWSMLLFGERPTPSLWVSFLVISVGLSLVEPRQRPDGAGARR